MIRIEGDAAMKKRILVVIAGLTVLASGAGCGGSAPTPTSTLTATPTRTSTPMPTQAPTLTTAPTATSTPTEPIALAVPLEELTKRARAFVTARGYYPGDPVISEDGQGNRLLAFPSVCSEVEEGNHFNCQATHFFLEGTYLGTDTLHDYYGYENVRLLGSGQFAIEYTTYAPNDPLCCPSVKATVVYTWTGNGLVASGEPPLPIGQPFSGPIASQPQPLYIAIFADQDRRWFRFEGERILLPAGTSITVALADTSQPVTPHALVIPDISFRSPDTTHGSPIQFQVTFERPGIYNFHCPYHPEQEYGVIEVVPSLTP
jgi:plastocyanin